MPIDDLSWGDYRLAVGQRTVIMGIVNITPDSFSDGGQFYDPAAALAQARQMIAAGADIIDIGGESSRPFADPVPAKMEIQRTVPVIRELAESIRVPISIDTTKAEVAEAALTAGAAMINDISAFRQDPDLARVAAAAKVPVILMHMQGTPRTMQKNPQYADVAGEVAAFLEKAVGRAVDQGVERSRIILDPGIGFGKTVAHNYILLRELDQLVALGQPVLVGPSRKAFIRKTLADGAGSELKPDSPAVEAGTQAAIAAAVMAGAHIVRVHSVAPTVATVKVIEALRKA